MNISGIATTSSTTSSQEAGPSRQPPPNSGSAARVKGRKQPRAQKLPQKSALLRLDPESPLIPSLTPAVSLKSRAEHQTLRQRRAQKLSQLHAALDSGTADAVWSAYLDLRQLSSVEHTPLSIHKLDPDSALTAREYASVVKVINNDATKSKRGANRILRLMADVRGQQRRLLSQLQQANEADDLARSRILRRELDAWDGLVSPELLNTTIARIGRSLRSIGREEIDLVLDQLLTYEANEHSRRKPPSRSSNATSNNISSTTTAGAFDHLRMAMLSPAVQTKLGKRRSKQRLVDFPDLPTYNTILDIITRTLHRSKIHRHAESKELQAYDEEDDDQMARVAEQQIDQHSAELSASIANKLNRLDLDADAASLHVDAFERADRLFHSVLDRMQRKSHLEPDATTYNIMITMYCLLGRWDKMHQVIRSANSRGLLSIDCINNALGLWLVHGPASSQHVRHRDQLEPEAMESALELYRQLRQNLVSAELASQRSSISYGRRNSTWQKPLGTGVHGRKSHEGFGPLAWPDRDDLDPARSAHDLTMAPRNDALQAILGIPSLPQQVMPDEITHALMIKSLTREGRFADALSVLKDLVSTPVHRADNGFNDVKVSSKRLDDRRMRPTLAIFDSFFRGFSRHGRPSAAIVFDSLYPERTEFELLPTVASDDDEVDGTREALQPGKDSPHVQQLQLWRVEAFQEIFTAFLDLEPDIEGALGSTARGQSLNRGSRSASRNISTPFGWLTLAEKRRLDAIRRAPSPNQLFWILTAIRRVSDDHAEWSLAMWQKVANKFDPHHSLLFDKVGWTGYRLDNRMRRVIEHLEARLAQGADAQVLETGEGEL